MSSHWDKDLLSEKKKIISMNIVGVIPKVSLMLSTRSEIQLTIVSTVKLFN